MYRRILSMIMASVLIFTVFTTCVAAETTASDSADIPETSADPAVVPEITRAYPYSDGVLLTWTSYPDASKYYVFTQKASGGWKRIGESSSTSFTQKNPAAGASYIYTVRAADADGNFISDYDRDGYPFTYLATPTLISVTSVNGGQRLSWEAVEGASAYMVYVKTPTGWKELCLTSATVCRNTAVTSGEAYTYTVRCWDTERDAPQSYFVRKGITGVYVAAPRISSFTPANGGITLSWKAVAGAYRYGVFVKQSGKWKRIGTTDKTSYTHLNLTANTLYTYTVRCIDKNGSFSSGYDATGIGYRYIAPPKVTKVSGSKITWNAVSAASGYRVYRKNYGKSWSALGTTAANSYTDSAAPKNTLYTYTVRCLNKNGVSISYFTDTATYYYNGAPANGVYTSGGKSYRFTNGVRVQTGYVTINGKMYYYDAKGVLQKNGLVGSAKDGYRYADKNGVINLTYTGLAKNANGTWYLKNGALDRTLRTAVTVSGVDYNILNGKAYKVSSEKDRTLFRALKLVTKVTKPSMTKSQKLKAVWEHLRTSYGERNPRIPHYHGPGWAEMYANDIFVNGTGNCFSYGAAFAYLAKAIGYSKCYACNSGGHGWAEVEGLVYDPEWSMHNHGYSYYGLSYNTRTDVAYKSAISRGEWWMHVAV